MNTELLIKHLKQLQHSFKAINDLQKLHDQQGSYVSSVLKHEYPFDTDLNELTSKVINWTNIAIEELQ